MDIEAAEKQEIRKKQVTLGILFAVALALALLFASWMGALGFKSTRAIFVRYNFAGGVENGSPVRLAGIRIGRVSALDFDSSPSGVLRMKLEIDRAAFGQVTADSAFYVNLAGLIGERYVEIVPGKAAPVEAGHEFRGIDPPRVDQLLSQGYGIFGDLREFFSENRADLKEMFFTLNDLSKNLNRLLAGATPKERHEVSVLLENFAAMSGDLRATVADLHETVKFVGHNGSAESWNELRALLGKANKITLRDIRRLMMEDGVKVNFSSKKIPLDGDK